MALPSPVVPSAQATNLYASMDSINDLITAFSGGGQTSAVQVTTNFTRVSTVGAGGDSIKLPQSTPTPGQLGSVGVQIWVMNSGANSMQVYGASPDTINGVATGTGVAVGAGKAAVFTLGAIVSGVGQWYLLLSA